MTTHLVKLACELPDDVARSLSTWTCTELAKTLIRDATVDSISPSSVQRIQKQLERGAFAKLWRDDGQVVRLTASELALFIEGCTLVGKQTLSPIAIERTAPVTDRAM